MNKQAELFLGLGTQYYVSARFAALAALAPVCTNGADKRFKQGPTPIAARTVSSYGRYVKPSAAAGLRADVEVLLIDFRGTY